MEHESDGFERAFKLAEEHKFDELLEHLRVDDPRYGRLVDTCVRDERLLHVCARAGVPALEVIELLVEHGANKRYVFKSAAHNGQVDLLEAARARGWSDECTYGDVFFAAAEGGDGLAVFKWLVNHRATLDSGDHNGGLDGGNWMIDDYSYGAALHSALANEDIDAAAYLLDHSRDLFVRCSDTEPDKDIVMDVANEGVLKSLDFLCERWGVDFVTTSVDLHEPASGFDPEYREEIEYWLQQRFKGPAKEHLMNAMSTLDTVKENLPEGAYLQIVRDLQGAYKGM
ncbi:MAG: hypothetical protein CMK23_07145 [Porticoccaceae bacterium]|nr:hypothetical protein [Porticoccaceae bacterium]